MTTSSSRRTRRTGSLRVALTVPALAATTLLVPALASPAMAAAGDATQNVRGFCNQGEDLGRIESETEPVSVNLPVSDSDVYAGRADAARQIAASYTDVDWTSPNGSGYESCSTSADYTQKLTVGAGTSGLAAGTPVTLRASISFAGTLDTGNHSDLEADALTNFFADYEIDDLDAPCVPSGEGCYSGPAVQFSAEAERNTWSTFDTWSDPDGYLWRSHQWSWALRGNMIAGHLGDDYYDEAYPCPSFPCTVVTGPEQSSAMDPLTLDLGTKVVEFSTTIGATLQVSSGVDTYAAGADGPAQARADVLDGLRSSITGLPGSGVEVLVGTGPFQQVDDTAPTVAVSAAPAPNAAGWNNTDVTVSYSAADEAGGSGVAQLIRSATGAGAIPSAVVPGSSGSDVISTDGVTEVQVAAQDVAGNTSAATTQTVRIDKTAPVVAATAPAPATAGPDGTAPVSWTATATDALDAAPALSCTHTSGSAFPVGTTPVTCTATDHAGNTATRSFDIVVTAAAGGGGGGGEPTPVPTAKAQVQALLNKVYGMTFKTGTRESLLAHITPLQRALEVAPHRSCDILDRLDKKLDQLSAKSLTAAQLTALQTATGQLRTTLAC